jgi:hypothetical protein
MQVSLGFQSGSDQQVVRFYINQYQELRPDLGTAKIHQGCKRINKINTDRTPPNPAAFFILDKLDLLIYTTFSKY